MNNAYCAAPWRGLHINFRGDVKTCCAGNPNILGNINTYPIQEILSNDAMCEIRETIKSGKLHPEYCSNCIKSEQYGRSERHWHNDVNPDFDVTTAAIDDYNPTIIDIRWNTTCNLSCNYCGESCSSKWAGIKKGMTVLTTVRPYYEQVCDFLENHAQDMREVAMVGGEPLLLQENSRLLDVIPEECIVTLITNGSVEFERNSIFKKLQHRTRVGWSISFDNIGKHFEYVRHGSDWNLLNHNIDLIKDLMVNNGHWGGIHAVYNIYNCTRLVEFREWAHDQGLTVLWQNLFQPECLDPAQLGPATKDMAHTEVQRLLDICGSYLSDSERDFFNHAITNLAAHSDSNLSHEFKQHIADNELKYHKDKAGQFVKLWPELEFLVK
jgi:MoaA/NifB/PqqE/SkfB family radical SAM enzyme